MRLYGWRPKETLAAWGTRLQVETIVGPGAAEINYTLWTDDTARERAACSPRIRSALARFLSYFLTVQKQIVDKNATIKNDEMNGKFSSALKSGVWSQIVNQNKPEKHPSWSKFSDADKKTLEGLVTNKREHNENVTALRKFQMKMQADPTQLAACLLTITRLTRATSKSKHSVFASSADQAERVFRILLEVGLERCMRSAIQDAGPSSWLLTSESASNVALSNFFSLLERLEFSTLFHGPETHYKNGPMHEHFNAAAILQSLGSGKQPTNENTHIFFD